jgi:two-component system, NtrC family, sensor histidine kinase HydH
VSTTLLDRTDPPSVTAVFQDITERKRMEGLRRRAERLEAVADLSASLAHEIRNPLASLKGNAQLLSSMLPAGEKSQQKAARVVDEAVRLEALTNDLLEFVRTGELRRVEVDPAALARESAAAVDPAVEVDASAAPARWSLDEARMREVLVNLIDNAVAAGPPVAVRVARDAETLVIEVRDHGPGVAPDDAAKIFEPFFTRKTRGTGLGLAIVRRVVQQHGGAIAVDAAPGGGARFRVTIPRSVRS